MMNSFIQPLTLLIFWLLILMPSIAVWRSLSRQASGRAGWFHIALSLIGPFIGAFVFVVSIWLSNYSGQCGGWLGESHPCRDFGQYTTETAYWALMSMAVPGLIGILLGAAVLIFVLIRRRN